MEKAKKERKNDKVECLKSVSEQNAKAKYKL